MQRAAVLIFKRESILLWPALVLIFRQIIVAAVFHACRCSGVDILKAAQFYRDHLDHRIGIVVLAGGQNRAFSTTENLHVPESPMESKDHKRIKPQPESQEIGQAGSEGDDVLDELLGLSLGNESESGPLKIQDTKDAQKNALPRIGDEVMPHKVHFTKDFRCIIAYYA